MGEAARREADLEDAEDIPPTEKSYLGAAELAETIGGVPAIVFAFTVGPGARAP